jgi:mono/diheme cytochrome c family protein
MLVAFFFLLAGCGTGPGGADSADVCADAPLLTYDNFGRGFLTQNCQPCHATTSVDRHGADPDVTFDTYDDVVTEWGAIVRMATGPAPAMPPSGGIVEADREKLSLWLACGE